ncbi:hypothetical protein F5X97DRAFT_339513 [Nemania serpens]|nr:hypothetical protein F5X97DRAFT_339513 [Nemania serpens]
MSNNQSSTIQAFGLTRQPAAWDPKVTAFLDPYIMPANLENSSRPADPSASSTPEWRCFEITLPRSAVPADLIEQYEPLGALDDDVFYPSTDVPLSASSGPVLLNVYAVSPSHCAYVTSFVQLTAPSAKRLTKMRYSDMIADNMASAATSASTSTSSPLSKLRWLCLTNNSRSRLSFKHMFDHAEKDILARGSVEIRPVYNKDETDRWLLDYLFYEDLTRGVFVLLHDHARALGGAYAKRFIFISEGYEGRDEYSGPIPPPDLRLHLVVELARLRDGEHC